MASLLIADDEKNIREGLEKALNPLGHEIHLAEDGREAFEVCLSQDIDLIVLDIKMPKLSGLDLMRKLKEVDELVPIIFLTGHGSVEVAVRAMQEGAYDFLTKPINLDKLELVVRRALNMKELVVSNRALAIRVKEFEIEKAILGRSKATKELVRTIKHVAPSTANIYIYGESGTGKEDVCNAIHHLGLKDRPLVKVNCAALPQSLMESELFGHEKGAFTGAEQLKIGRFEAANNGTLFLDEVSEIPTDVQVKLLRVLQERTIERIGSHESIPINCRLICASNKDLRAEVRAGRFRSDLFYRINVIDIFVSPLRERVEDIDVLARHFFDLFAEQNNKTPIDITPHVFASLRQYSWPGNVRELRNVIEKMVVLSKGNKITTKNLPIEVQGDEPKESSGIFVPYGTSLREAGKKIIIETLRHHKGNHTQAAKSLGIGRKTLHRRLRESPDDE